MGIRRSGFGRQKGIWVVLFAIGLVLLFLSFLYSLLLSPERKALRVVEEFYVYEQAGDYGQSWGLLHTQMRLRFDRTAYVQDKTHVFNGHFGAETFSFDISAGDTLKGWRMQKDGEVFEKVYEFVVEQKYKGKYGHFLFVQYVYVAQDEGEWRILWDYNHSG